MDIKIGVGLDNLIFGMSQEEVKECLGKPNKISEKQKDDGIVYHYNGIQFKVKFDQKENLKLYSIEVYNPKVTLFNQKIIGKKQIEIKAFLLNRGYKNIEYEDYDFYETLFCESIWTTFTFELDRLRCFEFSPLFKNGEIVWPKI